MVKLFINKSVLDEFPWLQKARKGEQIGGEYIYRENIEEKVKTQNGKQVITRYKYYYLTDMLKDSAESILSKIGKFFFKGKEKKATEKIEKAYETENIKKDYGADKKTWYQHCMEYFSHRAIWDKRFSKKENQEKFKKPIKEKVAEKLNIEEMDTTAETFTETKKKEPKKEKTEKEWKPNPSLMRKVWSLYTGKEIAKEEKQNEVVQEVIDNTSVENTEHGNKTAMLGNDNAKKLFSDITDEEKNVIKNNIQNNIVSSIPKDSVPYDNSKSYVKNAIEWAKNNPQGNAETKIGEVIINEKSVERDLYHGDKNDLYLKLQTLPAVKDILENGEYLGYEKDFDGKPIDNHYFAGKINYGGEEKIVFCRVRENQGDNNRFYVHEVFTEDEIKKETTKRTSNDSSLRFTGKPLYKYILQDVLNVKENITKEATDAIKTVIANNSYAPEFSSFRNQVGAVIASINNNTSNTENVNENLEEEIKLKRMGDEWKKERVQNDELNQNGFEYTEKATIKECEDFAKENGVSTAVYKKFTLDNANTINIALQTLPVGNRPEKIADFAYLAERYKSSFKGKMKYFGVSVEDFYIGFNATKQNTLQKYKENNNKKGNIHYNTTYKATIFHEFGHFFANSRGISDEFVEIAKKWIDEQDYASLKVGINKKEGDFSKRNFQYSEAFAEAYAAYYTYNPKLPQYVVDFMDNFVLVKRDKITVKPHGNTIAMLGNQNAKKFGITDEEVNETINEASENEYSNLKWALDKGKIKNIKTLKERENLLSQGVLDYENLSEDTSLSEETRKDYYLKKVKTEGELQGVKRIIAEVENPTYNETIGDNENGYRQNNFGIEQDRLSSVNGEIRLGDTENNGNQDVFSTEIGNNRSESINSTSESRIGLGRLTKSEAKKIRAKCREILAKPDSEITQEDKDILRQYEGAGGLNEGNQTDAAVLSEFYTPRDVIKKVWQLVDKYNPNKNKKVIEPSSGTGRFAEDRDENFTLCELDETSARIAKLLHPKAEVKQGAFQQLFLKNNSVLKNYEGEKYDVAVGNPPYGEYSGRYKGMGEGKIHTRYEEYFIDRTLDTLKDGGIMAFVVPSGFLRNASSKAKEAIAKKGKLLEAWRLPKGTFSSTDVGTDIIVLRKEKGNLEDFASNKYFNDNPSHVIGTETFDGNWGSAVINLPEGKTVAEAIEMIDVNAVEVDKQVEQIQEKTEAKETQVEKVKVNYAWGDEIETPNGKGKVTGFRKSKGKTTGYIVRVGDETVEISAEEHLNRSNAMLGNQNAKKDVHAAKETNKKAKKGDIFTESVGHNMSSDEFSQKMGKSIPKEDMKFWKKTNWEGIIEKSSLTEKELAELKKNKNFIELNNGFESVVTYASGNIYNKLNELEDIKDSISQENYEVRKSLLEAVKPVPKKMENITVGVTTNFAKMYTTEEGENLVDKFLYQYLGFNKQGSTYNIKVSNNELEEGLTWNDIWDYVHQTPARSERGEEDSVIKREMFERKKQNRRETAERLFNEFLRNLPEDEKKGVEKGWNQVFNSNINPDFKKIPLFVEGLNTHKGKTKFDPTEQQIKGISELCNKGNGILAYDVGVGKTFCGIVATVNQLQTGKAKRPLICVPKAVYKKWVKEIHQHFPNIAVNELGNFSDKYLKQYKNEDETYNIPENALNVCTYEALNKITFKEDTINGQLRDDILDSQSVFDYDENGNLIPETRSEREKAAANEKMEKLLGVAIGAKNGGVFWEDLGIDHITVDELHNFKNIFSIPRNFNKSNRLTKVAKTDYWGRKIKDDDDRQLSNEFQGLSGASSKRGMKLFAISQLLQEENGGRGFFGLSATPFNNSPIEIYNILSLCARERLKELNIYNLQDFLREFAELKPDLLVKASGDVVNAQTMKNFKNLGALQNLITEFIDKVDGEEAGVIRPRKVCHRPTLNLTDTQKMIMEVERMRMEGKFSPPGAENTGDVLIAMNNMRMATLSPSLIDTKFIADYETIFPDFKMPKKSEIVTSSPKLQFTCDSVAKQYKERPSEGQVIYMPRGVENYDDVKAYLIKQGMPADSIAFMNSDTTLDKKEQITDDFNDSDGKIKVIIGSEVIKEGVSLNGNATTLYNTMLGWNPTETIQVEGRIWRQGNKQGITHIVYPLMNDSIDSMMMQKYDEKSSRLNALWSYKGDNLNVEDYDPEEVKFALIKDPKKRANLKILKDSRELNRNYRILGALYDKLYSAGKEQERLKEKLENVNVEKDEKEVEEWQSIVEGNKQELKQIESSLKKAKKEKADNIQELETNFAFTSRYIDRNLSLLKQAKQTLKDSLRYKKEIEQRIQANENYLLSQGVKDETSLETKLSELSKKRQDVAFQIESLKDKKEEFIQEAIKQMQEEAEKNKSTKSVSDTVNQITSEIGGDLRIMDDAFKAELKAEQETKRNLNKSLPLFIIQNGRFYIRKSLL